MNVMLATLCLNEMEHLPRLYQQHKDWPNLISWVFVESADKVYADTNPELVTKEGLSVDGTSSFLNRLAANDPRVTYIPYGFSSHSDPAQGKCASRNAYLEAADTIKPDIVFVLDADEYYTHDAQSEINNRIISASLRWNSFIFKQRHIWHPASIQHLPIFTYEVVKGYWEIPHCRAWRYYRRMRYTQNHNTPSHYSKLLSKKMVRFDLERGHPECVHLGFASNPNLRKAKHQYYIARGEGIVDKRQGYVNCRRSFETWVPGAELPQGAQVLPYSGPIPEVFHEHFICGSTTTTTDTLGLEEHPVPLHSV